MTPARELRFAFTFDDYEAALHLFRDVFGLETLMELDHQGGRGVILKAPVATIELFDRAHTRYVDEIEVGRPLGETVRIAVRVDDLDSASDALEGTKAVPVAAAIETPWGDRNQRYQTVDGLQLTLFAEP